MTTTDRFDPNKTYKEFIDEHDYMALKTARKMHICISCYKAIQSGQKYWSPKLFGWQNRLARQDWDPGFYPIRIHDNALCLQRSWSASRVEEELPYGRAILATGEIVVVSQAPIDHAEVGWSRETASSIYWHPDFDQ